MRTETWAIRSRRVVTPTGTRPSVVVIKNGKIVEVGPIDLPTGDVPVEDFGDLVVLPGLVDTHVHINDPGRADWEGFATATTAAAVGGITTLVDMPLNSSPVTTTPSALDAKLAAARGQLRVDCGFFGGVIAGVGGFVSEILGNLDQLNPLADLGVLGFKAFLSPSGIDEFPHIGASGLRLAMMVLTGRDLPFLAHAEIVPEGAPPMNPAAPRSYAAWLESRPDDWEIAAIRLLIHNCRETGCRVHIVHLATAKALPIIAEAKAEGLLLTVEACPHYLTFAAEEIPDGDPRFKCAPPIRSAANREALWEGLRSGLIDTIGTDHSPAPPNLKHLDSGDLAGAWGGISSLQLSLPAVWTEAKQRGFALDDLARWMAAKPAWLVGLQDRKGAIAPGLDADFAVVDPDAEFVVDRKDLHHRHPATPYEGRTLRGRVVATYLRGVLIARDGQPIGEPIGQVRGVGLDRLNALENDDAVAALLRCCGSWCWAERMAALRPFHSGEDLLDAADQIWSGLDDADRREAYSAHPKIGDLDSIRAKFATTAALATAEQSGVAGADKATLHGLADGNRAYEARFGHLFIVCATGKTAEEMLSLLRDRLDNDPATERPTAAAEQLKITLIRLRKLLG